MRLLLPLLATVAACLLTATPAGARATPEVGTLLTAPRGPLLAVPRPPADNRPRGGHTFSRVARMVAVRSDAHAGRAARSLVPQVVLTSDGLLLEMLAAADEWWAGQGSLPPGPPEIVYQQVYTDYGLAGGLNERRVFVSPSWWAVQYEIWNMPLRHWATRRAGRRVKIRVLAAALAGLIHERGHNIGYGHIPGTVMQAENPVVPGWCYEWVADHLPR